MEKRWEFKNDPEPHIIDELASQTGLPLPILKLLVSRGYKNQEDIETFLHPENVEYHDPFLMKDMDKAVAGIEKAIAMGYRRIGVSVVYSSDVRKMRQLEKEHDVEIITFGVHVTGMGEEEAKEFINLVDITTGCTSRYIREHINGHVLAQFGTAVPIFAIIQRGKEMLLERAKEVTDPILINTMKLPVLPEEKQPRPLI